MRKNISIKTNSEEKPNPKFVPPATCKCDSYHTRTKTEYLDPATVAYITGKWPENNGKIESEVGVCWGTKEQDTCNCGGDKSKCDFYENVRNKANEDTRKNIAETDINCLKEEIRKLNDEPPAYRFYYCDSENTYLLGRRMDTMYYAHWYDDSGFVWDMSRYLPWGETIDGHERGCAWGVHTYPSEPKEISAEEWFKGFLEQRLKCE